MLPPVWQSVDTNEYAEPRPPRRGSHRPAQAATRSLSGSNDQDPQPRNFLPVARYTPFSRHDPRLYAGLEQLASDSYATPPRYLASEFASFSEPTDKQISHSVRSPMELLQHMKERTPDQYALEKSILESYVRSAPQSAACQNVQKRCMYPSCTKISVSRGLCRGHGGGRRCHVPECTKSAQSRSNFCWAHGGGQRCEADQCMRSRKSKRFCVAHLHLDSDSGEDIVGSTACARGRVGSCRRAAAAVVTPASLKTLPRMLPSLGQALSSASRSLPNLPARRLAKSLGRERCLL